MPRGPRFDAPGVVQHVMTRGIERRRVCENANDYEDLLRRLDRVLVESGVSLLDAAGAMDTRVPSHPGQFIRMTGTSFSALRFTAVENDAM